MPIVKKKTQRGCDLPEVIQPGLGLRLGQVLFPQLLPLCSECGRQRFYHKEFPSPVPNPLFPHRIFPGNQSACPGPCPLAPSRRDCSPLWSRIILPCVPVTRVLLLISKEFFQTVVFLIFVTALLYGFLYPVYYS